MPPPSFDQNKTAPAASDQNKTTPAVNPDQPAVPEPSTEPVIPPPPKIRMPEPINGVDFGTFIRTNPFRLVRPEDKPVTKTTAPPPPPRSSVRVTGIVVFRGKEKVFLEVKRTGEKDPSHYTMEAGEVVDRIKVVSIDPDKGVVKLENDGQASVVFFDEEQTKTSTTEAFPSRGGFPSSTGASGFQGSRGSSGATQFGQPSGGNPGASGSFGTRGGARGGGNPEGSLKGVPTRRPRGDNLESPANPTTMPRVAQALPQWFDFDKVVQTQMVAANQIPTQRELPRGVFSTEVPTDLPVRK